MSDSQLDSCREKSSIGSDHGRIIKRPLHISKKRVTDAVLHDGKNDVTSMSLMAANGWRFVD